MSAPAPVYWPFPVLPHERQTPQHRAEVAFLEQAHRAGLRPCKFADGEYRIGSDGGRAAWVIARGRKGAVRRWEVWLNDGGERVSSQTVEGFDPAAAVALGWVRVEANVPEEGAAALALAASLK
jgi:hypothetical protein